MDFLGAGSAKERVNNPIQIDVSAITFFIKQNLIVKVIDKRATLKLAMDQLKS